MSLIPSPAWTVVLRDRNHVVLHHPEDRLIAISPLLLQSTPTSRGCPTCKRPWESGTRTEEFSLDEDEDFVAGNYFRLLGRALPLNSPSEYYVTEGPQSRLSQDDPFLQGYYDKFFVEERKLGRGQRGSVFYVTHVLNGIPLGHFALKAIPVGRSQEWLVRMLQEVRLLEQLHHPNIVDYKHAWIEDRQLTVFGPKVPCLFILMECASGGNLEEYLHVQWDPELDTEYQKRKTRQRRRNPSLVSDPFGTETRDHAKLYGGIGVGPKGRKIRYLTEHEIWRFFLDICAGLVHLHSHGIIHRDLKPSNLLLKDGDSSLDPPRILISDFGECEVLSDVHQQERTGATGTLEFMPPELLSRDSSGSFRQDHSQKADIWSLGVVLYFLCYSQVPYTQIADVELLKEEILGFKKVYFPYETPRVSQTLQELMRRLLQTAPELRPTVQEIYSTYKDSMPAFPVTSSRSKTEDATRVPLGNRPIEALSLTTGQRLNITELSVANVAGLSSEPESNRVIVQDTSSRIVGDNVRGIDGQQNQEQQHHWSIGMGVISLVIGGLVLFASKNP